MHSATKTDEPLVLSLNRESDNSHHRHSQFLNLSAVSFRSLPRVTRLLVALVLSLLSTGPAAAQRYSFHLYGRESGLNDNTVLALLQDKAGFLWVGTEGGLYRYEGSHFRLMSEADGLSCRAEVRGLIQTRDGALWTLACNRVFRLQEGHFEPVIEKELTIRSLQAFAEDNHGHLLIGDGDGILSVSTQRNAAGRFNVVNVVLPPAAKGRAIQGIAQQGDSLWFGCDHSLCELTGGTLKTFGQRDGLPDERWDAIHILPNGDLWLRGAQHTAVRRHDTQRFTPVESLSGSFFSGYIGTDADGSALIPTDGGLVIISGTGRDVVTQERGLPTSMVSAAIADREGSIWVGLIGEGLARWVGRREWEGWNRNNGLPSNVVWSIRRAASDHSLWVGTSLGIVRFRPDGTHQNWGGQVGLTGNVRWIGEAPDGAIWVIAQPSTLARIDPKTNAVRVFGEANGFTADRVLRGAFDSRGQLWVATPDHLYLAEHPGPSSHFHRLTDGPAKVWDVAEDIRAEDSRSAGSNTGGKSRQDRPHVVWATGPNGLWRYQDHSWTHYSTTEGLQSASPYRISFAPDGALWLRHRYDGVVERVEFKGEHLVSAISIQPHDIPSNLSALHGFDQRGHFWLGSGAGLAMLQSFAAPGPTQGPGGHAETTALNWRYFTIEQGLISNDCDGEAFWADSDGSVWFGTSGGLSHYQAAREAEGDTLALGDPVITSIQTTRRPRAAHLEFSSLAFKTESSASFAYSIDGGSWVDADPKERTVTITGLSAGDHHFEVRTKSWAHPWAPLVAKAKFHFDPFWWEMWWAQGLAFLLACGFIALIVRVAFVIQRRREREKRRMLDEKARAEAASQAKSLFLAHMSHEIRTPLSEIIGLSELLSGYEMHPGAAECVNLLRSSGKGLLAILNGILDFSKIEAGKLELEKIQFDLTSCLAESVALFSKTAQNKGISLELDRDAALPTQLIGDGYRLRQILMSLISNAVKFTPAGKVCLQARLESHIDDEVVVKFSVTDTGIGIRPDRRAKLFVPFTQGDASINRQYGGTGLGLTISKLLVELMGGSLTVESQPGVGSTFALTVPFRCEMVDTPLPESVEPANESRSLRILIAEDNKINQRVLLRLVEKIGYCADLANDGKEALEAALRCTYDLIVMDVQMPRMDGLEATRMIRTSLSKDRQPYIVALTAHATTDDRQSCLEAGMNDYYTKPIDIETLQSALDRLNSSLACRIAG